MDVGDRWPVTGDHTSAGCLDGSGDYVTTVPDVVPGEGYKIR